MPFFKKPEMYMDRPIVNGRVGKPVYGIERMGKGGMYEDMPYRDGKLGKPRFGFEKLGRGGLYEDVPINNGSKPSIGHPKFGFTTILNQHSPGKLPTAPAVVGGNVDWTKSKVTPATQYLHSVLSGGRPMEPVPALGSVLKLTEPTLNSIHTRY